jgi:AAA family ATP:ADP antiporter
MQQISNEARYYYEMSASLTAFKAQNGTPAARILIASVEARLRSTLERMFRLLGLRYPPKEIYAAYLAVNRRGTDEFTAALDFLDNILERELKRVLLPLLDEDARIQQVGRDLYGLQPRDPKTALRDLIRSKDSWLVICAIATAADLRLSELRSDIEPLSRRAGTEVGQVAQSAVAALA